jgi:hemoglobin
VPLREIRSCPADVFVAHVCRASASYAGGRPPGQREEEDKIMKLTKLMQAMKVLQRMKLMKQVVGVGLVCSLALAACGGGAKKDSTMPESGAAASDQPLFTRLGGLDAISAVVDEFLGNVLADARINARFAADVTDKEAAKHFRQMLIDQICEATGGGPIVGCKYSGKNMVEAHKDMKITDDEFNALVEDLVKALDKYKVPDKEKSELLGALGGMKGDIVGK